MLKLYRLILSILLIGIIFLRIPQESIGLASFGTKSDLLGSPRSTEHFLNILTVIGILFYFGISFQLNLSSS